MRNESDLAKDVHRMNKVNSILNNEEYQAAFLLIKAHILTAFEELNSSNVDDMREAHRKLQTLNFIEKQFKSVMTNGKIAENTLLNKVKKTVGII